MGVGFRHGVRGISDNFGFRFGEVGGASGISDGFDNRPTKRMPPVDLSRIKKMNGWSARKTMGRGRLGAVRRTMPPPEAAAASVPSSFTSTNAL
jgi:hypothetical protein